MPTAEHTTPAAGSFFSSFSPEPLLIAHRGFRACYPENSPCAFAASLGRSRMIELDVRLSRDGHAVVFHDEHLERTSDASTLGPRLGLTSLRVADWTLDQLRRLDIGSWFLTADPFDTLRQGLTNREALCSLLPQRIMTLTEVLLWAKHEAMPLNVEIKDMGDARLNTLLAERAIESVRSTHSEGQVIFSLFNHHTLRQCRQQAPEIAAAALQEGANPPDLLAYLRALDVCAYHPANDLVQPELVSRLRQAGFAVNVFTVNQSQRQRQLFSWGVTGIFTDFLPDHL